MNTVFRSGFVTLIGCPNVGKSTLMNRMVGQKVAIVTSRAQTTRNRIMGVVTAKDHQLVFLDTPGVTSPRNRLGNYMLDIAYDALKEVEAIVLVIDAAAGIGERDRTLIDKLSHYQTPLLAWINKCDIVGTDSVERCYDELTSCGTFLHVLKGSAQTGEETDRLESILTELMPEGPKYFPDDMVTDQPERVICSEIIREKALELLREEVPHGIGVSIDKMETRPEGGLTDIYATVYCERESHKSIIIGKSGSMLKKIGQLARKDMEWLLGTHVNLQLWIKIKEDWRNKESILHELGYDDLK